MSSRCSVNAGEWDLLDSPCAAQLQPDQCLSLHLVAALS